MSDVAPLPAVTRSMHPALMVGGVVLCGIMIGLAFAFGGKRIAEVLQDDGTPPPPAPDVPPPESCAHDPDHGHAPDDLDEVERLCRLSERMEFKGFEPAPLDVVVDDATPVLGAPLVADLAVTP